MSGPSEEFAKLIVLLPKFTGALSIICSCFVMNHIVGTPGQLSKIANRLLLGVTAYDTLFTSNLPFLGSWMVPRGDTVDAFGNEIYVYGNVGNRRTCTLQGFVDQYASKCSWVYNAELALAYFVTVKFRRGDRHLGRAEPLLHLLPHAVGIACAVAPLFDRAYNFTGGSFCWIAESPLRCGDPGAAAAGAAPCERGASYGALRFWTANVPLLATQFVVLASMVGLLVSVVTTDGRSARYRHGEGSRASRRSGGSLGRSSRASWRSGGILGRSSRASRGSGASLGGTAGNAGDGGARSSLRRRRSSALGSLQRTWRVALKCALYVLAFEITWFFNLWGVVEGYLGRGDHEKEGASSGNAIFLLNLVLFPTYGVWGALAYYLLPYLRLREAHPDWGWGRRLRATVLPPPGVAGGGDGSTQLWEGLCARLFGYANRRRSSTAKPSSKEEAATDEDAREIAQASLAAFEDDDRDEDVEERGREKNAASDIAQTSSVVFEDDDIRNEDVEDRGGEKEAASNETRAITWASSVAFGDDNVWDKDAEEKEEEKEAVDVEEGAGPTGATGNGEESPAIHAEL